MPITNCSFAVGLQSWANDFFAKSRLVAQVDASSICKACDSASFPSASEEVLCRAKSEDAEYAEELRRNGRMSTKAFMRPCRISGPLLPEAGSEGATAMYARWVARAGPEVQEIAGLDGFFDSQNTSHDNDPIILPFLSQSADGRDCGKCGVFQQYRLAAEAARLHVTCYVFIHFYSRFRRVGDLEDNIEMQAKIADVHLFCISIDLSLAKSNSDLTCEDTKRFWIERVKSGQLIGVGGGPSCETWSAARHGPEGPKSVRSFDRPWGLPACSQWRQVLTGTKLVQFLDLLALAAAIELRGFLEHPAFPVRFLRCRPASVWTLDSIRMLVKLECFQLCMFDQCIYSLPAKKPTTLLLLRMSTFRDLSLGPGCGGRCPHPHGHAPLKGKNVNGNFLTAKAKIYPREMNLAIALSISRFLSERLLFGGIKQQCICG